MPKNVFKRIPYCCFTPQLSYHEWNPPDSTVLSWWQINSPPTHHSLSLSLLMFRNHSTHPVLIQGETSVGKTSLIRWLAAATGNQCVRINNHEHTDIQEYIGCYSSDDRGKLVFREGTSAHANLTWKNERGSCLLRHTRHYTVSQTSNQY